MKYIVILTIALTNLVFAENKINPLAATETNQFATLLGAWDIKDYSLDKNGKWQQGVGADWNWYTILDGHAIQDDWIQPPVSVKVDNGKRQYGTNIRIYNPKKQQWEMAWASNGGKKIDTFVATKQGDNIVMTGLFNGFNSRITFFNMKINSFDWKLEYQSKIDATIWNEVYRIKGSRK